MLSPATETLWHFLEQQPALAGFVLIGGSALALRIQHRASEDLDLAYCGAQLPRGRLDALQRTAAASGFSFERDDDEEPLREFLDGGLDLHDFQQNFLVNRETKVSFFAPDQAAARALACLEESPVRVATLSEIFKTKCLVSAVRSKTRDWLDLFLLMRDHGFTIQDFNAAFAECGAESQRDIALTRLCSGVPQKDDEGYAHLLQKAPTWEEMRAFFIGVRDQLEIELAAKAKASPGTSKSSAQ